MTWGHTHLDEHERELKLRHEAAVAIAKQEGITIPVSLGMMNDTANPISMDMVMRYSTKKKVIAGVINPYAIGFRQKKKNPDRPSYRERQRRGRAARKS